MSFKSKSCTFAACKAKLKKHFEKCELHVSRNTTIRVDWKGLFVWEGRSYDGSVKFILKLEFKSNEYLLVYIELFVRVWKAYCVVSFLIFLEIHGI